MEKQKILIVDDSEMNRALLADILEEQYDVAEAENGMEAISILRRQRAEFSLLLLDIMMPEMDGFEVLACINRYHWNDTLAVIMISADDSPANIKRAYDLGAFDYISRPFDSTIVQRRISNTMFLYARQQRLEKIIAEQFHEQEKNNKLMISILSHIVEFRNGESGLHILHVNTITKYLLKQLVQKSVVLQNGHPGIGPQQKIHPHGQHDEHHSDALHLRPLLGEHIGYRVSDQQSDQCGDDGQLKRAGEHRCIGTHAGEVLQREVPGGGAEGIDHHNDDGRHHEDGHPSHIGNGEQ